jgi:hypothetical protein
MHFSFIAYIDTWNVRRDMTPRRKLYHIHRVFGNAVKSHMPLDRSGFGVVVHCSPESTKNNGILFMFLAPGFVTHSLTHSLTHPFVTDPDQRIKRLQKKTHERPHHLPLLRSLRSSPSLLAWPTGTTGSTSTRTPPTTTRTKHGTIDPPLSYVQRTYTASSIYYCVLGVF